MKTAWLLLAILATPALAWSQPGGDAAHSGVHDLERLDVVQTWQALDAPWRLQGGPAMLLTQADAVYGLGRNGAECALLRLASNATAEPLAPFACPLGAQLAGLTPDAALVCVKGSYLDGILQALDLKTGKVTWSHAPSVSAPDPASLTATAGQEANAWGCETVAVGSASVTVAFASTTGRNLIENVALDGNSLWATAIPSSVFLQSLNTTLIPSEVLEASGAFRATAVAASRTGYLISGRLDGTGLADAPPGLAWLDMEGTLRGAYVTSLGPQTPATSSGATLLAQSRHPVAQGALAASLIGDSLFVVDPRNNQGTLTPLGSPSLGQSLLAGPCWERDHLFVPGEAAAFVVPSTDPSGTKTWPGVAGSRIQACMIATDSAWVLVTREDAGKRVELLQVDLQSARTAHRVILGMPVGDVAPLQFAMAPVGDGLWVVSPQGSVYALAPQATAPRPRLEVEDAFPPTNTPAALVVTPPAGAPNGTTLHLAWGDGLLEDVTEGRYSHSYAVGGTVEATLLAKYPDNRTATAAVPIYVGQAPPPPKSWIEIAFSPDNQEVTFTVIGAVVSVIGLGLTALGVHRGRHRLDRNLRRLDTLRERGRLDPFQAIRDLHAFREERREDLRKGVLENPQFMVLESAATQTLAILRQRILGTYVGRVSDAFSHQLDVALADGSLDDHEADLLMQAVAHETNLDAGARIRLVGLIESWKRVI